MNIGITTQIRVSTMLSNVMQFVSDLFAHGWDKTQALPVMKLEKPVLSDSVLDEIMGAIGDTKSVKIPNGQSEKGELTFQTVAIGDFKATLEKTRLASVDTLAIDGRTRLCAVRILSAYGHDMGEIPTVLQTGTNAVQAAIRANMLRQVRMSREDRLHAAVMLWKAGKVNREKDIRDAFGASPAQRTIVQTAYLGAKLAAVAKLDVAKLALLDYQSLKEIEGAPAKERKEKLAAILEGKGQRTPALGKAFWETVAKNYPLSPLATFAGYVVEGKEGLAEEWLASLPDTLRDAVEG